MLKDVVEVEAISGHRLRLRFEDGVEGVIGLSDIVPFEGVFAPLRDPEMFAEVHVNRELGTVCWPNGADLDPDVLYALVQGQLAPEPRCTLAQLVAAMRPEDQPEIVDDVTSPPMGGEIL